MNAQTGAYYVTSAQALNSKPLNAQTTKSNIAQTRSKTPVDEDFKLEVLTDALPKSASTKRVAREQP